MENTITKQKDGTTVLEIKAAKDEIAEAKQEALTRFSPHIDAPGFRKGKAPLSVVERQVRTDKLVEETLSVLASTAYEKSLVVHTIEPIAQPTVTIPAVDNKPTEEVNTIIWPEIQANGVEFTVTTYVTPEMKLGEWEKKIAKVKQPIATPEIETAKTTKEAKEKAESKSKEKVKNEKESEREYEDALFDALIESAQFDVPEALVNGEAQNMLMQQVRLVEQLGMSFESYLKSQNKQPEDLQNDLKVDAERSIRTRFIIGAIADEKHADLPEKPTVKDVLDLLKNITSGSKTQKLAKSEKAPTKKATKAKS